jgi:metallophosphoesterase superfamily enzyme
MKVHNDWLLTGLRVAIHVPTAAAVVADLHLGYNACRRGAGEAIPFINLNHQLNPLGIAIKKHGLRQLVIAGDLFEAGLVPELMAEFQHWLADAGVELAALVPGNHDRGLESSWPLFPDGFILDGWRIVHGNEEIRTGEPVVHGHVHPAVRLQGRKFPCFLVGPRRLVLPAYSLDAAGVNVAKERTWQGCRCFAICTGKVIAMGKLGARRFLQETQ